MHTLLKGLDIQAEIDFIGRHIGADIRMSLKRFCAFTVLGSSLWVAVLTWIGYFVGNNPELMRLYYKEVCVALALGMVLILAGYIFWQKKALS